MNIKMSSKFYLLSALLILGITGCTKPPKLANMKICEALETTGNCQIDTNTFQSKKQKFFISADSENFKNDTAVKLAFTFLPTTGDLAGKEVPLTTTPVKPKEKDKFLVSTLEPPAAGWPVGKYRVEFILTPDNKYNREFVITP
jgi:hypothetical protein